MLRRFVDDLMYSVSRRRLLVLAAGGTVVVMIVMILVLTIPRGARLRPSEAAAALMSPNTELYFSLSIRPPGGQLRKMGQLIAALAENPTASRMWSDWMSEVESETGIDLESEVLPWLGPELAIGLESWSEDESEFLIVLETRDSERASHTLGNWRDYLEEVEGIEWRLTHYRGREVWIGETYGGDSQYYAVARDYILVANHDQAISQALERLDGSGVSLLDSPSFGEACNSLPQDRIGILFADGRGLFAGLEEYRDYYYGSSDAPILGVVRPLIPNYVAGSIVIDGDAVAFSLQAPTPRAFGQSVRGASKRGAEMIPASAAFCVFGAEPYALWTTTREKVSDDRELEERLQHEMEDLRYSVGFDLDDVVWRHFNGDFAVAGINAFPNIAGALEVENEQRLESELDNLLARVAQTQYEMNIDEEMIDGVRATIIRSEDLSYEGLSPGYAFLGNGYLAFGLTRDALRAIIRTYQGRYASLADDESYKKTMSELADNTGWIGYADSASVVDYLLAGFEPWERDVFDSLPRFEDVVCNAGFAFSVTSETIVASFLARLCSRR